MFPSFMQIFKMAKEITYFIFSTIVWTYDHFQISSAIFINKYLPYIRSNIFLFYSYKGQLLYMKTYQQLKNVHKIQNIWKNISYLSQCSQIIWTYLNITCQYFKILILWSMDISTCLNMFNSQLMINECFYCAPMFLLDFYYQLYSDKDICFHHYNIVRECLKLL